jgi:lactoylglutathione lyase
MGKITQKPDKQRQDIDGICFENPAMGIYFISDPDGYWIEVLPA